MKTKSLKPKRIRKRFAKAFVCLTLSLSLLLGQLPFSFLTPSAQAAQNHFSKSIMGRDLNLPSPWSYYVFYDGQDSYNTGVSLPIGSYRDGTINLGTTIPAGQYKVFVKTHLSNEVSGASRVDATLGGTTQTLNIQNDNWGSGTLINVGQATSNLTLRVFRTTSSGQQTYWFYGIYITADTEEVIIGGRVYHPSALHIPTEAEMDRSAPIKGNYLENSSFEIGTGHGWGLGTTRNHSINDLIDNNTAGTHGSTSIRYTASMGSQLISKAYPVRPNRRYTLSFYAKAQTGNTFPMGVRAEIINSATPPSGYGNQYKISQDFTVPKNGPWQRFSFSGDLIKYPTSNYYIKVYAFSGSTVNLWIDGIQLEEGDLSDYTTKAPVEVGLKSDHENNIFFEDEAKTMELRLYNNDAQARQVNTKYEVYDYYNQKVKEGTVPINIPAQSLSASTLDINPQKRGFFRAILWVEGMNGTREEVTYSVLPRPQTMGINENSLMGVHAGNGVGFTAMHSRVMQKVGVKWNRTLSTGKQFRWLLTEPTDNNFVWRDDNVRIAGQYGMKILGTIGSEVVHIPSWALPKGTQDISQWDAASFNALLANWDDYVYKVVDHYKNDVNYWEVWNEPNGEGGLGSRPDYYGQILQTAYNAIKRADPNAKVIGMVTAYSSYIDSVINAVGPNYADIYAAHLYTSNESSATNFVKYINNYGKPVWNTETGTWGPTGHQTIYYERENPEVIPIPPQRIRLQSNQSDSEKLTYNFLETIGTGFSNYFYYDSRMDITPYDLDRYDLTDYDDTLKPQTVAYSILGKLFDNSRGLGSVSSTSNIKAFLYERGTTPLVAVWSKDYKIRSLSLNLQASQIRAYDIMGNQVTVNPGFIPISASPIYIEGQGITTDALRTAMQSGTYSDRADTVAPSLSLILAPTGPVTDNSVTMLRWGATDEASTARDSSFFGTVVPKGIFYSYQLQDYDSGWSAWDFSNDKTYSNLPNGTYTFQVKAKDAAGNESPVLSWPVQVGEGTPDTTPPTVSLTSPSLGEVVSGSVLITASATDNVGVSKVEFYVDSTLVNTDTTSPYSYTWNSTSVANGTHTIKAVAYDSSNLTSEVSVTVTVLNALSNQTSGYVLDGYGGIHPFGGASLNSPSSAYWKGWDIAKDIAIRSDGRSGYVLDGYGGIHPFGGALKISSPSTYFGWDIARRMILVTDNSGYVLDGYGGIHPFGGASPVLPSSYWKGWDIAKDIAIRSDGRSGYVLDGYGGIHPFGGAPKLSSYPTYFGWDIARRMVLVNDSSGFVLDGYGGIHPFGGASLNSGSSTYWKGWDIAKDIAICSDDKSGYVLDGYGGIHPFGGAPKITSPSTYFGWNIARRIKLVQ